jgi:hypothetical protein
MKQQKQSPEAAATARGAQGATQQRNGSTRETYVCELPHGKVIVTFEYGPAEVIVKLSGVKGTAADEPRLRTVLEPLLARLHDDPRPVRILGEHAVYPGVIIGHGDNALAYIEEPLVSDLHRVGGGFSVRFHLRFHGGAPALDCEWIPRVPTPRELRRKVDPKRYRASRHWFLEAVGQRFGGSVVCVEMPGGGAA